MPRFKSDEFADLPLNKSGGLNLNWAIRQALDDLGVDAKPANVREYIEDKYQRLGKRACLNPGSFNSGVTTMKKKLREELSKTPQPPASTKTATAGPVATQSEPDQAKLFKDFRAYVREVLDPAMKVVSQAESVAGSRKALKEALSAVEIAEKRFGTEKLDTVVAIFVG